MTFAAYDILGHVFYAILFAGMVLLAWHNPWGWILRFIGELGWLVVGLGLGLTSVIVWDSVFLLCEVYGFWQWRRER